MDFHNLFDCAVLIPKDEAHSPDVRLKGKFGFSIDREALEQWAVPLNEPELEIPPRLCVYTAVASKGIISSENLAGALEWMKKEKLELGGDIFRKMRQVVFDKGNDTRHYEIWLPIAEKV